MRLRSPFFFIVIASMLLGAVLSIARQQGYLQFLELASYDLMTASLDTSPNQQPAITLILITEDDIQKLGNWPLTDQQLHLALTHLLAMNPTALGLDVYRDLPIPPGSEILNSLFISEPRIIAIEKFPEDSGSGIRPPAALQDTEQVGFSDLVSGSGGVVRRNLLFQSWKERTGYSFSLRLALAHLAVQEIYPVPAASNSDHLALGDVILTPLEGNEGGYVDADTGGYQIMLSYHGSPSPFPSYSLVDLLQGKIQPPDINNRIVILGVAAEGVKDFFSTPFSILDTEAGTLSGSAVHAHAAQQLLDAALYGHQPLRSWDSKTELIWLWLWIGLGFLVGWFVSGIWRFTLVMTGGVAIPIALAATAYTWGWWIPLVPILISWILAVSLSSALRAAHQRHEQKMLMNLFSRHVSPQVAQTIWKRREEVLDKGRIRPRTLTVTTLFIDMQGFTKVSEKMEPEPFLQWLNSYMAEFTDTIVQNGGLLDDFAGDGIKADFGVPFNDPKKTKQDALQAVHCALALKKNLTLLNWKWQQKGHSSVGLCVGMHTGSVVVGTVGSLSRMKYTTVGSNVNLAARLESLKEYPGPNPEDENNNCRILVSADTATLVAEAFNMQSIGKFELKGIKKKTQIFHIKGIGP